MTGSMLFAAMLVIGMLDVAVSGENTVKAAEATNVVQATYATPEQAGQALRSAVGDSSKLEQVLGPDSTAIIFSGDTAEDKAALAKFAAKYDRMNRWVRMSDGSRVLFIGADNYPYPIPLGLNSSAQWYFNTSAGKDEILARRIGKNELLAIDAVSAMANAEQLYFQTGHDGKPRHLYTEKILSTPGKQDGLYWEVPDERPSSPLGRLNEFAKDVVISTEPGAAPMFDGYLFRIITADKGGFTIVATPVSYGDSGIMTFVLSKDGRIYQKDLGPDSVSVVSYNPNHGWTPAE